MKFWNTFNANRKLFSTLRVDGIEKKKFIRFFLYNYVYIYILLFLSFCSPLQMKDEVANAFELDSTDVYTATFHFSRPRGNADARLRNGA